MLFLVRNQLLKAMAIRGLAEVDPEVHALSVRVTHLLEPPFVMARSDIIEFFQQYRSNPEAH